MFLNNKIFLHTCRKLFFDKWLCLNNSHIKHLGFTPLKNQLCSISNISFEGKLGTRLNVVRSELA